ncbi:unnamed protein product [Brugia timori]|uniref:Neur_chan_memb domain-containing protein n=1 Tax=Brugia timori TaxID=42155 RepID=A0A0R3QGB8_9BILA|nr:unnamed protein product [Brugia timori]
MNSEGSMRSLYIAKGTLYHSASQKPPQLVPSKQSAVCLLFVFAIALEIFVFTIAVEKYLRKKKRNLHGSFTYNTLRLP